MPLKSNTIIIIFAKNNKLYIENCKKCREKLFFPQLQKLGQYFEIQKTKHQKCKL